MQPPARLQGSEADIEICLDIRCAAVRRGIRRRRQLLHELLEAGLHQVLVAAGEQMRQMLSYVGKGVIR